MESQRQPVRTVYRSGSRKECLNQALVLEAVGIDYEVGKTAGEFTLVVEAADAARARAELDQHADENLDWSTGGATLPQQASGWAGVLGYVAVLLLITILVHRETFAADWLAAGRTQAGLIRHGQWWRTVTALTLHADLAHLMANLVIGGLFGLFAGQLLGSGLAWVSILIAGATGNLLNAWIREPGHTSIGASTAVFAALGMVATYVWKRRGPVRASKLTRWTPVIAGVVLLAYLGTGGVRTDVGAHVTGFLSGALLGALYGKLGDRVVLGVGAQFLLGMSALAVLALAWALALASPGVPAENSVRVLRCREGQNYRSTRLPRTEDNSPIGRQEVPIRKHDGDPPERRPGGAQERPNWTGVVPYRNDPAERHRKAQRLANRRLPIGNAFREPRKPDDRFGMDKR